MTDELGWQGARKMLGAKMKRVCVFCGSKVGRAPVYEAAAREFGQLLAASGTGMVYGGGRIGLMGAVADACLRAGGEVVGVIPQFLVDKEVAHRELSELRVVGTMHERKALMVELSDGFVALPGGFGTWDELCEVLTWGQIGLHSKPCAVLNVNGYYDPLLAMADRAMEEGFVGVTQRESLLSGTDARGLLAKMSKVAGRAGAGPEGT